MPRAWRYSSSGSGQEYDGSRRGPEFHSKHPYWAAEDCCLTPASGDKIPCLVSAGTALMYTEPYTYTQLKTKYILERGKSLKE